MTKKKRRKLRKKLKRDIKDLRLACFAQGMVLDNLRRLYRELK